MRAWWSLRGGPSSSDPAWSREERTDFDDGRFAHDLAVARAVLPLLVLLQLALVVSLRRTPAATAAEAQWILGLLRLHLVALPLAAVLAVLAWTRRPRFIGEAVVVLYEGVGVGLAVNAQPYNGALTGFVLATLGTATLFRPRLLVRTLVDVGSFSVVVAGLLLQPTATPRAVAAVTTLAVTLTAWATASALHAAGMRETRARVALEREKRGLEAKVKDQVHEIVARADEIDRLNAELAVKVQERSAELAAALDRLANAVEAPMLRAGAVVGDRVEIAEAIGFGGMGVVYRGRDRQTGRDVAVKLAQASDASEIDAFRRFLREAEAAARVQHPAIVRVLHVDVSSDGRLFMILELVEGQSLAQRLAREGHLDWRVATRLGAVTASALAAAHAAGVVHRDVKPENVMLTPHEPGIKVLDFGASLLRDQLTTSLTRPGLVVGTPEYLAPEQVVEADDIDGRADVYALGLLLYRCVAGHLPYEARNVAGWMRAHVLSRPATLRGESPPSLVRLLMRCLEKSADRRPTMAEVATELARIADKAEVPPIHQLERELAAQEGPSSGNANPPPASVRGALRSA